MVILYSGVIINTWYVAITKNQLAAGRHYMLKRSGSKRSTKTGKGSNQKNTPTALPATKYLVRRII